MKIGLDLDGTLITCRDKHVALIASLSKACNTDFSLDAWWALKRSGLNSRAALSQLGIPENIAVIIALQWQACIETYPWLGFDRALPRVMDKLTDWKKSGFELHLISARTNKKLAYEQLGRLALRHLFASITFVNPLRPHEKRNCFTNIGLDIYFGDTEVDFAAAIAAGITPMLVATGMRDADFLAERTGVYPLLALPDVPERVLKLS